jgi:hypothetical protein
LITFLIDFTLHLPISIIGCLRFQKFLESENIARGGALEINVSWLPVSL